MNRSLLTFCLGAALALPCAATAEDISLEQVVLRGLDKVTGRLSTMTVNVGEKTTFGALDIYARVCYAHPPEETPENMAFLEIVEKKPEGQLKLFSGWMFSSSPALSAMEHAVYDVWVIRCQGEQVKPPKPEPLVLENPIEAKPVLPKLKLIWNEEMQSVSSVPDTTEAEPVSGEVFGSRDETAAEKENKSYMILQMEPAAAAAKQPAESAVPQDETPADVREKTPQEQDTPAAAGENARELPAVPAFKLTPIREVIPEEPEIQEESLSSDAQMTLIQEVIPEEPEMQEENLPLSDDDMMPLSQTGEEVLPPAEEEILED